MGGYKPGQFFHKLMHLCELMNIAFIHKMVLMPNAVLMICFARGQSLDILAQKVPVEKLIDVKHTDQFLTVFPIDQLSSHF